ncbi:MAG: hypothetical protein WD398_11470 [Cyclobacteriaceae bacterium]
MSLNVQIPNKKLTYIRGIQVFEKKIFRRFDLNTISPATKTAITKTVSQTQLLFLRLNVKDWPTKTLAAQKCGS